MRIRARRGAIADLPSPFVGQSLKDFSPVALQAGSHLNFRQGTRKVNNYVDRSITGVWVEATIDNTLQ